MIRAVFLDAGQTVLRAEPSIGAIYQSVTRRLGVTLPPERFTELLGPAFRKYMPAGAETSDRHDYDMWYAITREMHAAIPELASVAFEEWFREIYDVFGRGEAWAMYDDAPPVLKELRARGLRLGIVSNWDTRLRRIVAEVGLAPLVDFLMISAEVGRRKPDAHIFEKALSEAGVEPEEAIHVGDLYPEDVVGAHAAGIHPVLIRRVDGVFDSGEEIAFRQIRSLDELPPLIEQLGV